MGVIGFTARGGASTVGRVSITADTDQIDEEVPPLVDRRTLLDDDDQAEFARVGYLRLPPIDAERVERLRAIYDELFPEPMSGFVPTYAVPMPERKAQATALVKDLLLPVFTPFFDRHRAFNSSFLMKWPGDDSALPLHQDVSYVDERVFRTVVVWVALDDADEELDNGPLQVVRGSHRFDRLPRGTNTWWPYGPVMDFMTEHCLRPLPVRRGDVLVMDNALLHCSFPNHSGRPRLAVALSLAPEEAGLIHTVGNDEGTVTLYDVDEQFFVDDTPYTLHDNGMPERFERREVCPIPLDVFSEVDIVGLCDLPPELAAAPEPAGGAEVLEDPDDGDGEGGRGDAEGGQPGRVAELVGALMRLNNRLIERSDEIVPVLDPAEFAWTAMLEAQWEEIRDEARAVLESRAVPLIEEVVGRSQGNIGDWNTFVLLAHGHRVEFNAALCPTTAKLLADVPGLQSALFSVFAPGTHLPAHQAPNRGVLRYHLGLIVPDPPDSCRLRVVDQTLSYREGESILFDDVFEHEAWNEGSGPRVTLLLELVRPLRAPYRQVNALTQRAFSLYPEARGAVERLERLEWVRNSGSSDAA